MGSDGKGKHESCVFLASQEKPKRTPRLRKSRFDGQRWRESQRERFKSMGNWGVPRHTVATVDVSICAYFMAPFFLLETPRDLKVSTPRGQVMGKFGKFRKPISGFPVAVP